MDRGCGWQGGYKAASLACVNLRKGQYMRWCSFTEGTIVSLSLDFVSERAAAHQKSWIIDMRAC